MLLFLVRVWRELESCFAFEINLQWQSIWEAIDRSLSLSGARVLAASTQVLLLVA